MPNSSRLRASSSLSSSPTTPTSATRLARLPSDIRDFLLCYPSQSQSGSGSPSRFGKERNANLLFYTNQGPGRPSKKAVTELQDELRGDYQELEWNHSFIQWFFPIREQGMNSSSQPLTLAELSALREIPEAMDARLESYRILLDFYGLSLVSASTGEVSRSSTLPPAPGCWKSRYSNLTRNSHNYLRMTRILKSNTEFGREVLNAGLLLWFLVEQARPEEERQLDSPGLVRSMDGYWRWCIRDEEERDWVGVTIEAVRTGERGWSEEDYREALRRREKTGSFSEQEPEEKKGSA